MMVHMTPYECYHAHTHEHARTHMYIISYPVFLHRLKREGKKKRREKKGKNPFIIKNKIVIFDSKCAHPISSASLMGILAVGSDAEGCYWVKRFLYSFLLLVTGLVSICLLPVGFVLLPFDASFNVFLAFEGWVPSH